LHLCRNLVTHLRTVLQGDHIVDQDDFRALDAGRRGKALVDQILAVSRRTPQGRRALEPATVLREVSEVLAASVPAGVTLELRVEEERARIMGDPTHFHRADMVEAAWKVADPILSAWACHPGENLPTYAPGTWGPPEAEQHHRWQSR